MSKTKVKHTRVIICNGSNGEIAEAIEIYSKNKPRAIATAVASEMHESSWINRLKLESCNVCNTFFDSGQLTVDEETTQLLCTSCKIKRG